MKRKDWQPPPLSVLKCITTGLAEKQLIPVTLFSNGTMSDALCILLIVSLLWL